MEWRVESREVKTKRGLPSPRAGPGEGCTGSHELASGGAVRWVPWRTKGAPGKQGWWGHRELRCGHGGSSGDILLSECSSRAFLPLWMKHLPERRGSSPNARQHCCSSTLAPATQPRADPRPQGFGLPQKREGFSSFFRCQLCFGCSQFLHL